MVATEGVGFPGAGVICGGKPGWVLGVKLSGSLEEQQVLLITDEPSL